MHKILIKIGFAITLSIILSKIGLAQSLSTGVAVFNDKITLSGIYNNTLSKNEKLSMTILGRYDASYSGDYSRNMLLGNLGYEVLPSLVTLGGVFYSYPSTPSPLFALQYLYSNEHFSLMLFPNLIFDKPLTMLSFISVEYTNQFKNSMDWFIRFQPYMVSSLSDHYFTSVRLRAGIGKSKLEGGLALEPDFTGNNFSGQMHFGFFLEYQIF